MSSVHVQNFNDLSAVLLSQPEREELHRSLRRYQRDQDIARLVDIVKRILHTPDREKLLPYIKSAMSKSERARFDKLRLDSVSASSSRSGSVSNRSGNSFPSQRPDLSGKLTALVIISWNSN
ncbi:hypothetical protein ElyMa_002257400 [Elysia marginata]|uniref:Caspase recruitment domain-containing protein n=1 Tax=Elysia marginata TaxID=1093978 RepID=A0AAV4G183_9GAST|nr:hypothetical protein ElyMa_002257400 [Elysia marginata]